VEMKKVHFIIYQSQHNKSSDYHGNFRSFLHSTYRIHPNKGACPNSGAPHLLAGENSIIFFFEELKYLILLRKLWSFEDHVLLSINLLTIMSSSI
jgi:hypothetical protein